MKNIRKFFFLFIVLFINKTIADEFYRCANNEHFVNIKLLIDRYVETARKNFLLYLPPYREKWETEYRNKIKYLNSLSRNTLRYPDVYQNILLFDQRIDLIKDFKWEACYRLYMGPGWAYSLSEKEAKIAKERAQIKKDTLLCKQVLYDCSDRIINEYIELFEECLKNKRACLAVYHDYGLLAYLNNNFDKSFELLFKLIDQAQETNQIDQLDSKVYHDLGSVCIEAMAYDKAIKYLSEAIKLDPNNKETYFQRATAYFETGSFDLAIQDYLMSDKGKSNPSIHKASQDFTMALINSACQNASEAAIEFFPSFCSSIYGLGTTIWTAHPLNPLALENIGNFADACHEAGECIVDYCKSVDQNTLNECIEQIKILYERFDQLSETEKGELIGHAIGKYGVEILAGSLTGVAAGEAMVKGSQLLVKANAAFRNLRNANRACTLETMAISHTNKEKVVSSALQHAAARESYFKTVKYNFDAHNKHVLGHNDYQEFRSIWEHPDPEGLLRKFAGKGIPHRGEPGLPNYKEVVDFGDRIGIWRDKAGKQALPTTRGTIHYSNKGAHIVPSHPNPNN